MRADSAVCVQCAQKVRTRAYRAAEAIRHSLRNGFTAYSALSLVIGLSVTIALQISRLDPIGSTQPQGLTTPASGRQDHTTSPYASRAVRQERIRVHRTLPHVS
jgi:hypothetical protein